MSVRKQKEMPAQTRSRRNAVGPKDRPSLESLKEPSAAPIEKPQTRPRRNAVGPKDRPSLESLGLPPKAEQVPGWYTGLKESVPQCNEYIGLFEKRIGQVRTAEDLAQLDKIRDEAQLQQSYFGVLQERVVNFQMEMAMDTKHEAQKEEGKEFFRQCTEKMNSANEKFSLIDQAVEDRKREIKENQRLLKKNNIVEKYRAMKEDGKQSPMMKLIARVKLIETGAVLPDNRGKVTKFVSGMKDKAMDKIGLTDEDLEFPKEVFELLQDGHDLNDVKETAGDFQKALKDSKFKPEEDSVFSKVTDTLKEVYDVVKKVIDAIENFDDMEKGDKVDSIIDIITSGLQLAATVSGHIAEALSAVPIIGGIIGLIKNVITFFSQGYTFVRTQMRMHQIRKQKRALRAKMLARKEKYAQDADLKDLNLYSYVGRGKKEGKTTYDKEAAGRREDRGVVGRGADIRNRVKAARATKDASPAGKAAYKKAKAAAELEKYDEMEEALYKNKNIRRLTIFELVKEGVDAAGNICSFFPGFGTAAQLGTKVLSGGMEVGHSLGSKAVKKAKDAFGHRRSSKNKKKFRGKYAENVYDHLAELSRYTNTQGDFDFDNLDYNQIKNLDSSYEFVDNLLGGMNLRKADVIKTQSKQEMLDAIADGFAVG